MDDKDLATLQRYIGKRSRGQTDEEVLAHIEKINSKKSLSQEDWEKLLYPACANCDTAILEYLLKHIALSSPGEYITHTLRFRHRGEEYEEKQRYIVERLFSYVTAEERQEILNEALVTAAWFGEYEAARYLIEQGAETSYQSKGRSILELSENAVDKFGDSRVKELILKNRGQKEK